MTYNVQVQFSTLLDLISAQVVTEPSLTNLYIKGKVFMFMFFIVWLLKDLLLSHHILGTNDYLFSGM